ncbi:unnamed protein product [Heterobilharzia americana]|nr:unnamed protein product [Heterobilharzia americana]
MQHNVSTYSYFDTPWDMFVECEYVKQGILISNQILCSLSNLNGILCAYCLPFIVLFNLISNLINTVIFSYGYQRKTRQLIYLEVIALLNLFTCLLEATLRLIPAKDLPFASNGRIFFSINNTSSLGCKLYRSALSMMNTLKWNVLMTAMLDRLLAIQFLLKCGKLPARYAWYFVMSTLITAISMVIPFIMQSDWTYFYGKIVCYERPISIFLSFYYGLVLGVCFIQTSINGLLNVVLLIKMYLWLRNRRRMTVVQAYESNELGACILLLIISSTTFLLSIPGAMVMFVGISDPFTNDPIGAFTRLRVVLNLRDTFLSIIYIQSIFNTIIYACRMKQFRLLFMCIVQCRSFDTVMRSYNKSSSIH